ncbi:MAG: DNA mismatch repair protein MutS, partial [Butyrivibrio sp.]|nr:DNA mismatch repair protein MutS [Butyrivibrio sp.]
MMQHYIQTKLEYRDCILFYRLGDFYEIFFDDALIASKELELTLTGKACGLEERAPMCGVPFHAVESYLNKLVSRGYKVAICEQMEDPKLAKGIVKRDVTRIVTPGTNLNMQSLEETKNNYLMSIFYSPENIGISVADVTTGDYFLTEVESLRLVMDEIGKYSPSEIICNKAFEFSGVDIDEIRNRLQIFINPVEDRYYDEEQCKKLLMKHFKVSSLIGLGIDDFQDGIVAAGALLQYLIDMQKSEISNITHIYPYLTSKFMLLDGSTRRNLELVETLRDKQKRGTLLWVLDKTKTAMGARTLRSFLEQPLISREDIILRQNAVEALVKNVVTREEIREYLNPVYDLERLMSKIIFKTANPRDLLAFRNSIRMIPAIITALSDVNGDEGIDKISKELDPLTDIYDLIDKSIVEEPPLVIKESGIIKEGFDADIDHFREAGTNGKQWLAQMEEEEKEKTGIKNLRIKYSNVFGYSFEVTNSFKDKVPDYFIRKQTLTNCERYTTPKLKELEDT